MRSRVRISSSSDHGTLSGLSDDDHSQYLLLAGRASTQSITKATAEVPVTLTDGATPALDASLGNVFFLGSTQNPTIAVPTNPTNGQKIVIIFRAISAPRTLALNTGAGGFSFGTDITVLSATASNTQDAIAAIYTTGGSLNKWMVVGYIKGFS